MPLPATTTEQEVSGELVPTLTIFVDRLARLLGDLEPDRSTRFPLAHGCTFNRKCVRCHVSNAETDHVTSSELTVNGEIEKGEVPLSPRHL